MVAFPTGLDVLTNPTPGDKLGTTAVLHTTQHATLNDAIEAIEGKVGIDGSANAASLDYLAKVALPKGVLGFTKISTADQPFAVGGPHDVTGLAVTFTVATSRRIRVTGHLEAVNTHSAGSTVYALIREGGIEKGRIGRESLGASWVTLMEGGQVVENLAAGTYTYKVSVTADAGPFSVLSSLSPWLLVEDIGKS